MTDISDVSLEADLSTELAPAKINLALHVTGRRGDGYHLIDSLVVFTRFGDRVGSVAADEDSFEVTGRYAAEKNLPVASGMGGGSSDAAATLRSLSRLWQLDINDAELAGISATLGADVPMCLAAKPLIARGTGDELTMLPGFPSLGLVLVNPGVGVPTADVFKALAKADNEGLPPPPRQIEFHSMRNWLETTRNDLGPAAESITPSIRYALAALNKADAGFARMSGSGATCFGLYETGNVAKRAAAEIRKRQPKWFVAATRSIPSEEA